MNDSKITVQRAKGRPMLSWVGKKPLTSITAYPAQLVESFSPVIPSGFTQKTEAWKNWPSVIKKGGLLFHGDNKDVLAYLLANGFRGKVDLIYIDPPFDSGADYVRKVHLRGLKNSTEFAGETYSLGEQIQYTDIWSKDNYLQFIYERMLMLKELLSEEGNFFIHCDDTKGHQIRILADEVFGDENFINEIIWKRKGATSFARKQLGRIVDHILWYSKSDQYTFNPIYSLNDPNTKKYVEERFIFDDNDGRGKYMKSPLVNPLPRPNLRYEFEGYSHPPNGWLYSKEKMNEFMHNGELSFPANKSQRISRKIFLKDYKGQLLQNIWDDIFVINPMADERLNFPTQKPESVAERIISIASNRDDLILDCFIGSGTTASVAQRLGRRWIGCDINKGALQTTNKRLQDVIEEQIQSIEKLNNPLPGMDNFEGIVPAQLSFDVFRVNDYDLQIQHNEAVNLACEHIGITRTHTDSFFDGTLGKKLARIIPFNHPLTPLDLEEVKRELDARKEEDRDIVLVCLGKELAADAWLEEWNKLRSRATVPNKIEVIELRTDAKYGGFMMHEPDEAEVVFERSGDEIKVMIKIFISPTIIKRLNDQSGVLAPQIDDWRCMVDSVMIDANYDGKVFNISLTDVPEKKDDLVAGEYIFATDKKNQNVAVKITDMLGEEVLIIKTL